MRFIPNILRPARPVYEAKIATPEETKLPETPLPEPTQTIQAQTCACCGGPCSEEQPHRITNGDLYLKRFPFTFLCNSCWRLREEVRTRHNIANKQTLEEQPSVKKVVPARPKGLRTRAFVVPTPSGKKPSCPLEMEDLAQLRLDDNG